MRTGDGAYMDEKGHVFIADRIKDRIITGGENVYSAEVENAVAKHEAVLQCAVIGVPDNTGGTGSRSRRTSTRATATSEEIFEHCRGLIANYKLPRSVAFVEEIPVSGAGKILKRDLREINWEA